MWELATALQIQTNIPSKTLIIEKESHLKRNKTNVSKYTTGTKLLPNTKKIKQKHQRGSIGKFRMGKFS